MLKKGILAAALMLLAAGVVGQRRQVMLDKVVAVVGGSSIVYSEVADYARQLVEQRRQEGYTSDRDPMNEALEALMTQKLLYNQAQIDSVEINSNDILSQVEDQVQQMVDMEGSISKLEAKQHMAIFNIREILRQRYEEQAYASAMQREVVSKVTVIPGEVERYYKSLSKDSLPTIADQYVYAQITKFPKSMKEAKQRARERLLDKRGQLYHFRHILLRPEYTSDELGETLNQLDSIADLIHKDSITFEKAALRFSDDAASKMNGGIVSNHDILERYQAFDAKLTVTKFLKEDFGRFKSLDDYNALIRLKPGEVSDAFLTEDLLGNQLGKIVKLVEVIPTHPASLNEDYLRLEEMALQDKQERVFREWLTKKIDGMYVFIDPEYRNGEFENKHWVK